MHMYVMTCGQRKGCRMHDAGLHFKSCILHLAVVMCACGAGPGSAKARGVPGSHLESRASAPASPRRARGVALGRETRYRPASQCPAPPRATSHPGQSAAAISRRKVGSSRNVCAGRRSGHPTSPYLKVALGTGPAWWACLARHPDPHLAAPALLPESGQPDKRHNCTAVKKSRQRPP